MTYSISAKMLQEISPFLIKRYLTQKSWVKEYNYHNMAEIYVYEQDGRSFELFLPTNLESRDYPRLMIDALDQLSKVEERPSFLIYEDFLNSSADNIRFRIPARGESNSISLEWGVNIVEQAKMLLAASAASTTARQKKGYYHLLKMNEVNSYLSKVRLGHTERGSFIVKLISPIPPQLNTQSNDLFGPIDDEPVERKVTENLALALAATKVALRAVEQNPDNFEPFQQAVEKGVSGNLCSALTEMIDVTNNVDISISWSMSRGLPQDLIHTIGSPKYIFSNREAGFLREAAKEFRAQAPREDTLVQGVIKVLDRAPTAQDGLVKIIALIDDQAKTVKVNLEHTDMQKAIQAFENKNLVKLSGTLIKTGRTFTLEHPEAFEIIDTPAE